MPTLRLSRSSNGSLPVSALGVSCTVSAVDANATASALAPEAVGIANPRAYGLADGQPGDQPIALPNILLAAPFGAAVVLSVACKRGEGDAVAPLEALVRIASPGPVWAAPLPMGVSNGQLFPVAVYIVDTSSSSSSSSARRAQGGSSPPPDDPYAAAVQNSSLLPYDASAAVFNDTTLPPLLSAMLLPPPAALLALDNVTACQVLVNGIQALGGGWRTAVQGRVVIPGVSMLSKVGLPATAQVACTTGDNRGALAPLAFAIPILPCPAGTEPDPKQGLACVSCPLRGGRPSYSDGGRGRVCATCPLQGASCMGGLLSLQPNFFRTPGLGDNATIMGETELTPCDATSQACLVASSPELRAEGQSHSCREGYTGVLCGLCLNTPTQAFAQTGKKCTQCPGYGLQLSAVIVTPLAIFGIVWWLTFMRAAPIAESGAGGSTVKLQILLRMFITYVQCLGTLGALYIAKGTQTFQQAFGLSQVIGGSVLQLSPLQCAMRLTYWVRYSFTLLLPVLMAAMAILLNICAIAGEEGRAWCLQPRGARARGIASSVEGGGGGGGSGGGGSSSSSSKLGSAPAAPAAAAAGLGAPAAVGAEEHAPFSISNPLQRFRKPRRLAAAPPTPPDPADEPGAQNLAQDPRRPPQIGR
jgi:uncharacterized membrane protein YgcG